MRWPRRGISKRSVGRAIAFSWATLWRSHPRGRPVPSRFQGELRLQLPGPDVPSRKRHSSAPWIWPVISRRRHWSAVLSLVRLWQQHGQREAVRALLAPLYARCTEGLDTPDLQYIFRPSGSSAISNALVLGVQLAMTL